VSATSTEVTGRDPGAGTPDADRGCVLCHGVRRRRFRRWIASRVVQCEDCGLVFVHPLPAADALHQHYNQGEFSRIEYYLAAEPADRRTFAAVLDRVARHIPPGGSVLDVGPNVGTALALAAARGWVASGVEINAEAARYCRERHGLNVVAGKLESSDLTHEHFDLVLMLDVIEHLLDPLATLRRVRDLLKRQGLLMISTPDIAGWASRLLQVKPEEHLFYFTPQTLTASLHAAGFRVECVESFDRHRNLTALADSSTLVGVLSPLRPLVRLARRAVGDLVVRLPLRENLLAVAIKE
jgi:2-polyprenyl-3-methyl-5-hydroxy-6-metoxy-1,4-benzoquinol methylase